MNYTSIEQSKKLLELGLSPESADMCYLPTHIGDEHHWIASLSSYSECTKMTDVSIDYCIPCWSLGALLEVMPKSIERYDSDRCYRHYSLNLFKAYRYCCSYSFGPSLNEENHMQLCCFGEDASWLDVVFKTVVWLIENGYIKTK